MDQTAGRHQVVGDHGREALHQSAAFPRRGRGFSEPPGSVFSRATLTHAARSATAMSHRTQRRSRRQAEHVRADHLVQQLLRVRDRQGRSEGQLGGFSPAAVDGAGRRAVQEARRLPLRGSHQAAQDRGSHLSTALRRGVVDGDPVAGNSAGRNDQALRAAADGEVSSPSRLSCGRTRCPDSAGRFFHGRTSKGCAWTRR